MDYKNFQTFYSSTLFNLQLLLMESLFIYLFQTIEHNTIGISKKNYLIFSPVLMRDVSMNLWFQNLSIYTNFQTINSNAMSISKTKNLSVKNVLVTK